MCVCVCVCVCKTGFKLHKTGDSAATGLSYKPLHAFSLAVYIVLSYFFPLPRHISSIMVVNFFFAYRLRGFLIEKTVISVDAR